MNNCVKGRKYMFAIRLIFFLYLFMLVLFVILKFKGSIYDIILYVDLNQYQRDHGNLNLNLIPFKTLCKYFQNLQYGFAFINVMGNFIPFIPMGFLLPLAYPKFRKAWRVCLFSGTIVVIFECVQFFTLIGVADIDDLILNTMGSMFGYLLFLGFCRLRTKNKLR